MKEYINFCNFIKKLALKIYKELGDGFDEDIYQRALAYELRRTNVEYLREANIEVFYLNQMLCLRELDFVVPKQEHSEFSLNEGVIIECKFSSKIIDSNRSQLRQYLKSLPKNQSASINNINKGMLLNWQKSANYKDEIRVVEEPIEIEFWEHTKKHDMQKIKINE